jgi:uncharacterized protein (DUF433 family)
MISSKSDSKFLTPTNRIVMIPAVCGGEPCIAGTRMPVRMLATYKDKGSTDDDLLRDFPYLSSEDLAAAWLFVESQPEVMAE